MTGMLMTRRAIAVVLCAALFGIVSACGTGTPSSPRIVGVGDIHGDYGAFETVMTRAGLMDANGDWAGGDTILIQTGDIADRGPDTRKIIAHLRRLQDQAPADGGQVIALVGNHEAMVMTGDYRYLHPGEIAAFADENSGAARDTVWEQYKDNIISDFRAENSDLTEAEIKTAWEERLPLGLAELRDAWAPDGEIGSWVKDNPVIVVLEDSLFVHGGLSAKYAGLSVEALNVMAATALESQTRDRDAIIHDSYGPAWYRGLLRGPGETMDSRADGGSLTIEEELDIVLNAFDVERIIVGHTPSVDGIKCNHDCRVIQIDTGMSAHYGGVISFIEFVDGDVFANSDGAVTQLNE